MSVRTPAIGTAAKEPDCIGSHTIGSRPSGRSLTARKSSVSREETRSVGAVTATATTAPMSAAEDVHRLPLPGMS
jgi:hypothetical protein